jgi:hypothetical protein
MTDREKRDFSLKWYADWMVERGGSEEEKKSFLETFGLLGEAKEKV